MNHFTIKMFGRTLLMLTAVLAVGLSGCGGDENPGDNGGGTDTTGGNNNGGVGGNDLVGDWTAYSGYDGKTGETHYVDDDRSYQVILSFRASGEFEEIEFIKIGNVWVEASAVVWAYRVSGSRFYIKSSSGEEIEGKQYHVSGNYFTMESWNEDDEVEITYKRVNIAEFRRSLGTVYTNDTKLFRSASYDYLIWYLQGDPKKYIEFSGINVNGNGYDRYGSGSVYYTHDNNLVLVSCYWEDDEDDERCTVSGTYQLTYKITGSGRNMQLSINGDIWLSAEYNDYFGHSYKRPVRRNTAKGFFAPFAAPSGHSSR